MVSIRVCDWMIMVIFLWGYSDRRHLDLELFSHTSRITFMFPSVMEDCTNHEAGDKFPHALSWSR